MKKMKRVLLGCIIIYGIFDLILHEAKAIQLTRHIFDISDSKFGAICDGIADDTNAINMAIEAAKNAGGGEVLIPGICTFRNGSIIINSDGISFSGINGYVSRLIFDNGSEDDFKILGEPKYDGKQKFLTEVIHYPKSGIIHGFAIHDLFIDNSPSKTAGKTITARWVNDVKIEHVTVNNAKDGIELYSTNNWYIGNVWVEMNGNTGTQLLYIHAPADGYGESQMTKLVHFGGDLHSHSDGIVLDGFVQAVFGSHVEIMAPRIGFWSKNTARDKFYYPSYVAFDQLTVSIASVGSVKIDGGRWFTFSEPRLANCSGYPNQGLNDDHALTIYADKDASDSQGFTFTGGSIGLSRKSAVFVDGQDVSFSGVRFPASNNTIPGQDAVVIGKNAAGVRFSAVSAEGTDDANPPIKWRYGIKIAKEAQNIRWNSESNDWKYGASEGASTIE